MSETLTKIDRLAAHLDFIANRRVIVMSSYNKFDIGYYKGDRVMPAHKCRMCITKMREIPDATGSNHFQKISEEWVNINGHQFRKDLIKDIKNGVKREIELVYEKPNKFAFNIFYLLATRNTMWVWILEPTED